MRGNTELFIFRGWKYHKGQAKCVNGWKLGLEIRLFSLSQCILTPALRGLSSWSNFSVLIWANIVGPTMWADKSWTFWHPISTMWKRVITQNLYFGFCQTFLPNKCVCDVYRNWPITNEQFKSQLNSRSCKHGDSLLEVAVGLICLDSSSWKIRNEQKLTWKIPGTSSLPQLEKTCLKSEKKYKNHRQA